MIGQRWGSEFDLWKTKDVNMYRNSWETEMVIGGKVKTWILEHNLKQNKNSDKETQPKNTNPLSLDVIKRIVCILVQFLTFQTP